MDFEVRGSSIEGSWWRRSMPLGMRALPQRKVGISDRWDLGEVVKAAMDSGVQPRVLGFGSGSD